MNGTRVAAWAAGAGYVAEGAFALGHRVGGADGVLYHHGLDAAYAVAVLGVAVALEGLAVSLRLGRVGRVGVRIAQVGCLGMGIESGAGAVFGRINALGPLFGLGILAALVGLVIVAGSGIRSGRARWAAPLPLLAFVVAATGGEVGASIVAGLTWWLLAVCLLGKATVQQPGAQAAPGASELGIMGAR